MRCFFFAQQFDLENQHYFLCATPVAETAGLFGDLVECSLLARTTNGFVVHLVARPLSMREVRGSKPSESNFFFYFCLQPGSSFAFLLPLAKPISVFFCVLALWATRIP